MSRRVTQQHGSSGGAGVTTPGSSLVWPVGLTCMVIAVYANVGLFETAEAAGVRFVLKGNPDVFITFQELTTGWRGIAVTNVLINTTGPFLVGLGLFSIALRHSTGAAVAVLILGVAFAITSLYYPLSLERTPADARDRLVWMHLVAGALFAVSVLPAFIARARDTSARSRRRTPSIAPGSLRRST